MSKPRVLLYDIETRPLEVYVWSLGEQNVGLEQLITDWSIIAFSAKWLDEKEVIYRDLRDARDVNNDKALVKEIKGLMDQADIVVTQNGVNFDNKKVNARLLKHGLGRPAPFKNIDTLKTSRKNFAFTSHKLAYVSDTLNEKYKKLEHEKFPGLKLWKECLAGNVEAWDEMKKYNIADVLALEEYYKKLQPWADDVSMAMTGSGCRSCGSQNLHSRGHAVLATGKFKRYQCQDCGSWSRDSVNLLSKDERTQIKRRA